MALLLGILTGVAIMERIPKEVKAAFYLSKDL